MFNHAFTLRLGCKHSPILGVPSIYADTLWCRTTKFGMVTYGRGLFLSGQPHPHLKGAGSHCSPILGVPFYLCTLYHGTTKFDMVTHMGKGRGMFLNGQPRPHPKGWGLCARKFLKFPLIFAYTLCRRTAKFDVVTHVGEVHVSWGQPCLLSQESGVPVIPNFWSSPGFMSTSFNTERPNSAW